MNLSGHTYLFTVTDRFKIEDWAVILIPGIPDAREGPVVRKGDPLVLRTPLGDLIHTRLQDFEMINYSRRGMRSEATAISLPKEFHKFDIPIGTEVYLAPCAGEAGADR